MTISPQSTAVAVATSAATETNPNVIARPAGGWINVWCSNDGSNLLDYYYQAYNENGTTDGGVVTLASDLLMTQTLQVAVKNNGTVVTSGTNTSIAALSDGGHVVTWTVRALTSEVRQQRYTATGAPNGAESQVSASPANDQVQSVVTGLKNAGWVV
ncbi:MAG: hypothetical protein ACT6WE_28345, partial [Shinella sp.]|uniref:hypothetical protein n=1 Tax=Shinella sp. TaxID=1870904 RepID=UPI0040368906